MKARSIIIGCLCLLFITACTKNEEEDADFLPRECNPATDGSITARADTVQWSACAFSAAYYSKDRILCIKAIDKKDSLEFRFYINIDSLTPQKTYVIGPYTRDGMDIVVSGFHVYQMDIVKPGIGGLFNLTQFDTVSGRLSASFSMKGVSNTFPSEIVITNGAMSNVLFKKSTKKNPDNSYVSATVNGVDWYTRNLSRQINMYIVSPVYSFLEVRAGGYPADLGDCPNYFQSGSGDLLFWADGRSLHFQIPLISGVGTYPLRPYNNTANQSITSPLYLFRYNHRNDNALFFPLTGSSITVTSIDTTLHRLDATFSTQARDALGNTVNIVNGKIHLEGWLPYPF